MAYWCDDYRLLLEQRRLDADQRRAKERMEAAQTARQEERANANHTTALSGNGQEG